MKLPYILVQVGYRISLAILREVDAFSCGHFSCEQGTGLVHQHFREEVYFGDENGSFGKALKVFLRSADRGFLNALTADKTYVLYKSSKAHVWYLDPKQRGFDFKL